MKIESLQGTEIINRNGPGRRREKLFGTTDCEQAMFESKTWKEQSHRRLRSGWDRGLSRHQKVKRAVVAVDSVGRVVRYSLTARRDVALT